MPRPATSSGIRTTVIKSGAGIASRKRGKTPTIQTYIRTSALTCRFPPPARARTHWYFKFQQGRLNKCGYAEFRRRLRCPVYIYIYTRGQEQRRPRRGLLPRANSSAHCGRSKWTLCGMPGVRACSACPSPDPCSAPFAVLLASSPVFLCASVSLSLKSEYPRVCYMLSRPYILAYTLMSYMLMSSSFSRRS